MSSELIGILGLLKDPSCGQFTVISQNGQSDSSFLLYSLLCQHLKLNAKVCLVSTTQTYNHYFHACQKLSVNLTNYRESGQLQILEGLPFLLESIGDDCTYSSQPYDFLSKNNSVTVLKNWYLMIKNHSQFDDGPSVLIIDDVSTFLSLNVPVIHVLDFINSCKSLYFDGTGGRISDKNSVIVGVKKHIGDDEHSSSALYWHLAYEASLIVNTDQLSTGLSKSVTGQMSITWNGDGIVKPVQQKHLYKLEDRRIKVLPATV